MGLPGRPTGVEMKLFVGLGNPGARYRGTRHNAGFDVAARLVARRSSGESRPKSQFHGETWETSVDGEKWVVLCPLTYMNLSGQAVREAVDFFRLPLANLLIICDDFSLPFGRLRLRGQGTAGGQNGLKHILEVLGTNRLARLRVGIGPIPAQWDPADFVLSRFQRDELLEWDRVIDQAVDAAEHWALHGLQDAMNRYNRAGDAPDAGDDKLSAANEDV